MNSAQQFVHVLWLLLAFVAVGDSLGDGCASCTDAAPPEILECFQAEEDSFVGAELRLLQLGLRLQRADPQRANGSRTGQEEPSVWTPFQQRYVQVPTEDLMWAARQSQQQNPLLAVDELSGTLGSVSPRRFGRIPDHKATWIQFTDHDPTHGLVMGDIEIGPAHDESDVTHYNIFWASNGTVMDFIAALPIGTYMHHLHARADVTKGVPIPKLANEMLVFTSNTAGMMNKGVAVSVFDFWRPPVPRLLKGLLKGL